MMSQQDQFDRAQREYDMKTPPDAGCDECGRPWGHTEDCPAVENTFDPDRERDERIDRELENYDDYD